MKFLIAPLLLLLAFCEFKEDTKLEAKVEPLNFAQETRTFSGETILQNDVVVSARKVEFENNSRLKLNQYNLTIEADEIHFNATEIIGFDEFEYNGCLNHGKNSGSIIMYSSIITGNPIFQLKGENAGKNGLDYHIGDNKPGLYTPDDSHRIIHGKFVLSECKLPSTVGPHKPGNDEYMHTSYNGGNSGKLYLSENSNLDYFYPTVLKLYGRGDFKFRRPFMLGIGFFPLGKNGDLTTFCILKNDNEVCFDEIDSLKKHKQKGEIKMNDNQVTLRGNLGSDANFMITEGQTKMSVLSVAITNNRFDTEQKKWIEKDPTWIDVLCFNKLADKASVLQKGDRVIVQAKISVVMKKNEKGENIKTYSIVAKDIEKAIVLKNQSFENIDENVIENLAEQGV